MFVSIIRLFWLYFKSELLFVEFKIIVRPILCLGPFNDNVINNICPKNKVDNILIRIKDYLNQFSNQNFEYQIRFWNLSLYS